MEIAKITSIDKLKILAYDCLVTIEQKQAQLSAINQQIVAISNGSVKEVKPKKESLKKS